MLLQGCIPVGDEGQLSGEYRLAQASTCEQRARSALSSRSATLREARIMEAGLPPDGRKRPTVDIDYNSARGARANPQDLAAGLERFDVLPETFLHHKFLIAPFGGQGRGDAWALVGLRGGDRPAHGCEMEGAAAKKAKECQGDVADSYSIEMENETKSLPEPMPCFFDGTE
jgi:hypothetical protein